MKKAKEKIRHPKLKASLPECEQCGRLAPISLKSGLCLKCEREDVKSD